MISRNDKAHCFSRNNFPSLTSLRSSIPPTIEIAARRIHRGSFTVSNLGNVWNHEIVAIINPPQAAILSVGGIEDRAIVKEGKVVPGKTMRFVVSADHRVIDGADVAKFLKTLSEVSGESCLYFCYSHRLRLKNRGKLQKKSYN